MVRKIHIWILTMMIFTLFVGNTAVNAANAYYINTKTATVNVGDEDNRLVLEIKNLSQSTKKPKWTSWNENIAKVEQQGDKGIVTALSKGKTVISSGIGFPRETCVVTVVEPKIQLNKTNAVLYHGGSAAPVQLKATIKGANKNVVWSSSDTTIAAVNEKGTVSAKGVGTAVITAVANGKSATCNITVLESALSLNIDAMRLSTKGTGSSIKLVPEIVGENKKVIWKSSDTSVAKVKNGKVTGKRAGTATITAVANGMEARCAVTVIDGLISVNEEYTQLYITGNKAETKQLKTNAKKNETVAWSSSDDTVAAVDKNGLVRAKKAGVAVIAATCKGKTDSCVIRVADTAIHIPEKTIYLGTMGAARTYTVDYSVTGRKNAVKWKSSNTKIASVKKGKITAKKEGTTTITVEANGVKETIKVIVQKDRPSITFKQNEYTLYTKGSGKTVVLKPIVSGKNQKVIWQSGNREVAEVSDKGKVTAKKEGTTWIKATVNNVTQECMIRVRETKVTLDEVYLLLNKGEKRTLGVEITGASQSVKYSTTNAKAVTVKKGVITAKNYGEADIKVKANGVTSVCHVFVTNCTAHDWKRAEQYDKEPTCTESGLVTYTCTKCNGKKQEETASLGHDFGEWKVEISATESTMGREKQICSRCGVENFREIPKLPSNGAGSDQPDQPQNPVYKLVWEDNFDGEKLNLDDWNFEYHEPGWVNAELQAYVDSERNTYVKDGMLYIQAIKEMIDGKPYYTSGRINTQKKHDFQYGRFEVRAKVPSGKGFLPAFWMMPTDESFYGQWPKCGEIDIMEVHGSALSTSYGTLHFGEPHTQKQGSYTLPDGQENFSEAFHVFACEWDPGEFRFYVDGHLFYTVNDWFTKKPGFGEVAYPAPYDQPFYLILNLAVGGSWVGYPDEDAVFGDNAQFVIDYVRAYQKDSYDTDVDKPQNDVELRDPDETGNYVINGDFSVVEDLSQEDSNWQLLLAGAGEATANIADNALHVTTTKAGELNYSVQVVQANLPLGKGMKYELSYDAYADEARSMITGISAPDKGYIRYLNDTTVELTTEKQTYRHVFDMTGDSDANSRLEFNLGNQGSTAAVHISNVRLKKTGEAEEEVKGMLPDGNYVYNGQFNEGNEAGKRRLAYWEWDIEQCSGTGISVTDDSRRELRVSVPDTVTALDQVAVYQNPIAIGGGKKFIFSFDAYADREKTVKAEVAGNSYDIALTTERQTYKYEFETSSDLDGSELRFLLGSAGTAYIDNVTVREDSLIVNGDFSSGMLGYEVYVNDAAKVPNYIVDSLDEENAFAIDIADTGAEAWQIQLKQNDIRLEKDKWYKLAFDAKSTKDRTIMYALQRDGSKHKDDYGKEDWTPYSGEPKAALTGEWQNFSKVFRMGEDTDPNTILSISLGAVGGTRITEKHTVVIDNITLEETDPVEEPPVENLIQNGDFAKEGTDWTAYIHEKGGAKATVAFTGNKARYEITNAGTEDWNVQLKQGGLAMEKGSKYKVNFKIASSLDRRVKLAIMGANDVWCGGADIDLTKNKLKSFSQIISLNDNYVSGTVAFQISMGKVVKDGDTSAPELEAHAIEISEISVTKVDETAEADNVPDEEMTVTPPAGETENPEEPTVENLIKNGDFAEEGTYWTAHIHEEGGAKATVAFTGNKARYEITNAGTEDWNVQLKQGGLAMEKGSKYKVNFKIASSLDRRVKLAIMGANDVWCGGADIDLTKNKLKSFSQIISLNDNYVSGTVAFQISMGKVVKDGDTSAPELEAHAIEISEISVTKVDETAEADNVPDEEMTVTPPAGETENPEEPTVENLIKNGDFAEEGTDWKPYINEDDGANATVTFTGNKARYEITNAGTEDWYVQLKQEGLAMEKGSKYKVNFKIASSLDRRVKLAIMGANDVWCGGADIDLTKNKLKSFSQIISLNDNYVSGTVAFQISMGKVVKDGDTSAPELEAHAIEISEISVTKVDETAEADNVPDEEMTVTPPAGETENPEEPTVENLIKNGDFAEEGTDWKPYINEDDGANATVTFTGNKARYEITNAGTEDWYVQLKQEGLAMEKGSKYKVNFKIASSLDRRVKLAIMGANDVWCGGADIDLTKNKLKSFSQIISLNDNYVSGTVAFQISMGKVVKDGDTSAPELEAHAIEISEISVTKVDETAEADNVPDEEMTVTPPADNGSEANIGDDKKVEAEPDEQQTASETQESTSTEDRETESVEPEEEDVTEPEEEDVVEPEEDDIVEAESTDTKEVIEDELTEVTEEKVSETESIETEDRLETESIESEESVETE